MAVQTEGSRRVKRSLRHYSLDAIILVGYRADSRRGVRFRQWATSTLRERLVRGYAHNQQRLGHNAREPEAALAKEEACDLMGQANELRLRQQQADRPRASLVGSH